MLKKTGSSAEYKPFVLVVDDDPSVCRVIEDLLQRNGFEVKTASSGVQALGFLRDTVPAVLILDVMMPEMSGYDLCQIVKREQRLERVPVVFLTARGAPGDYKTGHELGAVIYLTKPFKPERLLNVVRMVTARRRA